MGLKRAQKYNKNVKVILGGGAVSVFYEQLGNRLPRGTVISVGEGELKEKLRRVYFLYNLPISSHLFPLEKLCGRN